MSLRLERAIDEVNRIERKIQLYQNQKKEAMARLKLVENEEIIKTIRTLNLDRNSLVELLKGIHDGTVTFSDTKDSVPKPDEAEAGDTKGQEENTDAKEMDETTGQETNNDSMVSGE